MSEIYNKHAWNLWTSQQAKEMEKFIISWPLKGCSQFKLGKIRCDWNTNRTRCRGGLYKIDGIWQPGISIAMSNYIPKFGTPIRHYEYKSFDKDRFIGGFYSDNMEHPLLAVIAHETAHAIQKWLEYYCHLSRSKPHGKEFRDYYAKLRAVFVNPLLPDQKNFGQLYDNFKNIIIKQELGTFVGNLN